MASLNAKVDLIRSMDQPSILPGVLLTKTEAEMEAQKLKIYDRMAKEHT